MEYRGKAVHDYKNGRELQIDCCLICSSYEGQQLTIMTINA